MKRRNLDVRKAPKSRQEEIRISDNFHRLESRLNQFGCSLCYSRPVLLIGSRDFGAPLYTLLCVQFSDTFELNMCLKCQLSSDFRRVQISDKFRFRQVQISQTSSDFRQAQSAVKRQITNVWLLNYANYPTHQSFDFEGKFGHLNQTEIAFGLVRRVQLNANCAK